MTPPGLRPPQSRERWLRTGTAEILKRFHFCERSLLIGLGGWLAALAPLEAKTLLPRHMWQIALTADALRERVLELRYPNRLLAVDADAPLIAVVDEAHHAPGPAAYLLGLARVIVPALRDAYALYAQATDPLADEPSLRFVVPAIAEHDQLAAVLSALAEALLARALAERSSAEQWAAELAQALAAVGGLSLDQPQPAQGPLALAGRRAYHLPGAPARDDRFFPCRYYWPDIVDPAYPYGEGVNLQLRSAVSHFNEIWAVEFGGAVLHGLAGELPWQFSLDAARWTYDESRHVRMGLARLEAWGYAPAEIPLGDYIYTSARGEPALVRLAMLHYFETKNIGHKTTRAQAFGDMQDKLSQHDMEFDWADETIHAHYGRKWFEALRARRPAEVPDLITLRNHCRRLVAREVASAAPAEVAAIRAVAEAMLAKRAQLATGRLSQAQTSRGPV